jgi:hypothetical protein
MANQIRAARATLENELATGRARIEDVLTRPPATTKTAAGLSERQRVALIALLRTEKPTTIGGSRKQPADTRVR